MHLQELRNYCLAELSGMYDSSEMQAVTQVLLEDMLQCSGVKYYAGAEKIIEEEQQKQVMAAVKRLKSGEPLQYVLGYAHFSGLKLKVSSDVLIPRPETEELVDLVLKQNKHSAPVVLDLCTGSGCIALAVKYLLPTARVYAADVSEKALEIARNNSEQADGVTFMQSDLLQPGWYHCITERPDIIISNPPYVAEHERNTLSVQVLQYEPHLALFAPEDDPLFFYRRILDYALAAAVPETYLELNPLYADQLLKLYTTSFRYAAILKDMSGNMRFGVFKEPINSQLV